MLDWYVANALFKAVKGQVILSGDPNQLPPVKGGSVFAELLKILPTVELNKVHRFNNGVNKVSIIHKKSLYEVLSATLTLASYFSRKKDDFQVISPIKYSMVGVFNLNRLLQDKLNPDGRRLNSGKFRIGDRVIVKKNLEKEIKVYNGQSGIIVDSEGCNICVKLNNSGIILPFMSNQIELSYALTVHKVQGSQYNKVIFVSPDSICGDFMDASMKYTGETRGTEKTFVIKHF